MEDDLIGADERLHKRIHDRDYLLWVKTQPCVAGDLEDGEERSKCSGAIEAHHAGTSRGMSQKADDRTCIPLCAYHHRGAWHGASGVFKEWDREQRRAWAIQQICRTQARHARGAIDDGSGSIPW